MDTRHSTLDITQRDLWDRDRGSVYGIDVEGSLPNFEGCIWRLKIRRSLHGNKIIFKIIFATDWEEDIKFSKLFLKVSKTWQFQPISKLGLIFDILEEKEHNFH